VMRWVYAAEKLSRSTICETQAENWSFYSDMRNVGALFMYGAFRYLDFWNCGSCLEKVCSIGKVQQHHRIKDKPASGSVKVLQLCRAPF
jgi:hypothetical protein